MKIKWISVVVVLAFFSSSSALAYQRNEATGRDRHLAKAKQEKAEECSGEQCPGEAEPEAVPEARPAPQTGGGVERRGRGVMIGGYVLAAAGSAAALAGSTLSAVSSSKRTTGIIIASSGAALGIAGGLMIMLGGHMGLALAPTADPDRGAYGMALAANF